MRSAPAAVPGVLILDPVVREDERGYFFESHRDDHLAAAGVPCRFVQENQSGSSRGVVRGLHYQIGHAQAKLVRVVQGEIFDVAVDLRRGSATFGKWAGEILSASNRRQMFVPVGFAHGFAVLSETADVVYKCSDFYSPKEERGILWNDPALGIAWPLGSLSPVVSARDATLPPLDRVPPADLF